MRPPLDPALFDFGTDTLWALHCGEGPVPRPTAAAVEATLDLKRRPWELDWGRHVEGLPAAARCAAAALFGGDAADFSLTPNTSAALATVARGYPWRPGDEIVLPLGEFPSNFWPWKAVEAHGVTVRGVPLWTGHRAGASAWESTPPDHRADPEERLLAAIRPRTRLLAVSWVRFQDGLVLDLERLAAGCRAAGVELVVDGIQGAGTVPLDLGSLPGVSAFASGGHKGLLCPHGMGLLWTDPDFRSRLTPPGGWLAVEGADDWSRPSTDFDRGWAADAERLEGGLLNLQGAAALAASLELLREAGVSAIADHVAGLQTHLLEILAGGKVDRGGEIERLEALGSAGRIGSILAFHHGGSGPTGLLDRGDAGRKRGIWTSVREGYLRVALHGWHDEPDVERIADWLGGSWQPRRADHHHRDGDLQIPGLSSPAEGDARLKNGR